MFWMPDFQTCKCFERKLVHLQLLTMKRQRKKRSVVRKDKDHIFCYHDKKNVWGSQGNPLKPRTLCQLSSMAVAASGCETDSLMRVTKRVE